MDILSSVAPDVIGILQTLNRRGYEAYAVGGCVRDLIMGKTPKDWDITTSALPDEVRKIFPHTFATGIQHGTVTVVMRRVNYEVTTFRVDGEYKDNRRPESVSFDATLEQDLARRDFTMNAIAWSREKGFTDPFGGMGDIAAKLIRGVGDPDKRFKEDALRVLRAVRFAGQLGFGIEKSTYDAIAPNAHLLRNISVERIRVEFAKLLASDDPRKASLLADTGVLERGWPLNMPLSADEVRFAAERMTLLENADDVTRFALLLHGRRGAHGKDSARAFMANARFDNVTVKRVANIVYWARADLPKDDYRLRVCLSKCGVKDYLAALNVKRAAETELSREIAVITDKTKEIQARGDCLTRFGLAVNGGDFLAMNLDGRKIGETLEFLLDEVLKEPRLNDRDALLERASSYLAGDGHIFSK